MSDSIRAEGGEREALGAPLRDRDEWPLRPWVTAALLGLAGLLIHFVTGSSGVDTRDGWRAAAMAFLFFGSLSFAFTLERTRWKEPLAFALIAGLVMAGLAWRAVAGGDDYAGTEFGFIAGLIATAIALPLFQADFHRRRFATPYAELHDHVWSDAISAAGALAFTGASWLLLLLLSELFHLLRIDLLRDVLDESWFGWSWSGAAFGAALGVLRNQLGILGTLRSVVTVVLSILAVPLALGLALFLVAMILSGPDVLWQATRSATPILLVCAAGAWVLANAIIRGSDAEASGNRALRSAGLVLALSVLPLTVFAAISLGTRVEQHGLTPDRLWGMIAVGVACLYGHAWLVAVVRGRKQGEWRALLRQANLHLAAVIAIVALLLALPILDFGAISARNQIARLESGKVSEEKFDFAALRWDFGDAGRRALARLAGGEGEIAKLARVAQLQTPRPYPHYAPEQAAAIVLRVEPANPVLEQLVRDYLASHPWVCSDTCVALDLGPTPEGKREVALVSGSNFEQVALPAAERPVEVAPAAVPLKPDSEVEVRTMEKRYIFIDGKPLGRPLED